MLSLKTHKDAERYQALVARGRHPSPSILRSRAIFRESKHGRVTPLFSLHTLPALTSSYSLFSTPTPTPSSQNLIETGKCREQGGVWWKEGWTALVGSRVD